MTSNIFRLLFLTNLMVYIVRYILVLFSRDSNVVNDPAVEQTVVEQTKHLSEMIDRHQKYNYKFNADQSFLNDVLFILHKLASQLDH